MKEIFARLVSAYEDLSGRERILVISAGVLLIVGIVYAGMVRPAFDASDRAEQRRFSAEQQLTAMARLREEFDDVHHRLTSVEDRIRTGPKGNLRTTLESLAKQALVKVESMEPQASPAHELYRENKVEVDLKSATLSQTVNYLHQIESAQQVLSVKSLRIRTRPDNPELLDVTFTVSSFEPL
jgi:general secretion pathway protein M